MRKCRICRGKNFTPVLDMGEQPKVNSLLNDPEEKVKTYPLVVEQCEMCGLVQVVNPIDSNEIYRNEDYLYISGDMPGLENYFAEYARELKERFLQQGDFVIEIGSNDGLMLKYFRNSLGVDPSSNVVVRALKNKITTLSDFYGARLARSIEREFGKARLIYGNNCIAHIDDLHDVMDGVTESIKVKPNARSGIFAVECNYWGDMVRNTNYSLIYHDHFSYFTAHDWDYLANMYDLTLFDAYTTPSQGGSLRVFLTSHKKTKRSDRLEELLKKEELAKFASPETSTKYRKAVMRKASMLGERVKKYHEEGKVVAGYGAAAKGFSLLSLAEITDEISFFVDDSTVKQGKFTPVHKIPVVARNERPDPDVFFITAPNYSDIIIEKEKTFLARGGIFLLEDGSIVRK